MSFIFLKFSKFGYSSSLFPGHRMEGKRQNASSDSEGGRALVEMCEYRDRQFVQ